MGNIIIAECEKCSFSDKFSFGATRADFQHYNEVPALVGKEMSFDVCYFKDFEQLNEDNEIIFYTDE